MFNRNKIRPADIQPDACVNLITDESITNIQSEDAYIRKPTIPNTRYIPVKNSKYLHI